MLYRKHRRNPSNEEYLIDYKKYRNYLNKKIIKVKENYFSKKLDETKNDMKAKWKIFNEMLNRGTNKCFNFEDKFKKKPEEIANDMASNFIDQVIGIRHECNSKIKIEENVNIKKSVLNSFVYLPVTVAEVVKIIEEMDIRKSPGCDQIRVKDIKYCKTKVAPVLTKMINLSIFKSEIPDELKVSLVKPIHKSGNYLSYNNYRPISIMPTIEKILERCVSNRIIDFLEKNNVINDCHYGFRKNKSTEDLLSAFSNIINKNLDKQNNILVLFVDLSKAFDTLDHSQILNALESAGIRGLMLDWFKNYFTQRSMYVNINNVKSSLFSLDCGVGQGTILGPLVFSLFVNKINAIFNYAQPLMYADDLMLVVTHNDFKTAENNLQKDFNNLIKWTHNKGLIINSRKTKIMSIQASQSKICKRPPKIVFHDNECLHKNNKLIKLYCECETEIEVVEECKHLGIIIDDRFTWEGHYKYLNNKLKSLYYVLSNIQIKINGESLVLLYKSLVESHLRYGISSWGSAGEHVINKLQLIQNRFIKMLGNKFGMKDKNIICQNFNILMIKDLYEKTVLEKFYFKIDLCDKIINRYNTRMMEREMVSLPMTTNKYGKRTLDYVVKSLVNDNVELLNIKTQYELKKVLKFIYCQKKERNCRLIDLD